MDRMTAIRKARYFRLGATVITVETGAEHTYESEIVGSRMEGTRVYHDFRGNPVIGPRYNRTVTKGPSIAAAKRATRGMSGVVAEQPGENLRRYLPQRKAA